MKDTNEHVDLRNLKFPQVFDEQGPAETGKSGICKEAGGFEVPSGAALWLDEYSLPDEDTEDPKRLVEMNEAIAKGGYGNPPEQEEHGVKEGGCPECRWKMPPQEWRPDPNSMWLVVYECIYTVVHVSPCGRGFFAPGQDPLWHFNNIQEWVCEIKPPPVRPR